MWKLKEFVGETIERYYRLLKFCRKQNDYKDYREAVLDQAVEPGFEISQTSDPFCLATIKHYCSLIPLGQEHRKPIFGLTPADGAIGSHANAISDARQDFKQLVLKISEKIGVQI